jgi:DNA-binding FadR family transcriptional regulator
MKKLICAMLVVGSLGMASIADAGWRWEQRGRSGNYHWTNTNRPSRESDLQEAYRQLRQAIRNGNFANAERRLERAREISRELIDNCRR